MNMPRIDPGLPRFRVLLPALLAAALALPAVAQQPDQEGSKDHPSFSRMPGFFITDYQYQEFSSFELNLDPPRSVEGQYWSISYELQEGMRMPGPLQIARNYTNLVRQRGGTVLLEDVQPYGGTSIARMPQKGGGDTWLQVSIVNNGQIYELRVVQEAGMRQDVAFTAESLAAELSAGGVVAVRSILFDTGKATIQPASSEVLGVIVATLKADPGLRLEIRGHTDNVGQPAANLALSRDRAAAVKAWLVGTGGIAAARLSTAGFGDTRPVADNATEDGRARNRRVELARK